MSEAILSFIPTTDSGSTSSIAGILNVTIPIDAGFINTNIEGFKPFNACLVSPMYGNNTMLNPDGGTVDNVMIFIPQYLLTNSSRSACLYGYAWQQHMTGASVLMIRYIFNLALSSTMVSIGITKPGCWPVAAGSVNYQLIFFK